MPTGKEHIGKGKQPSRTQDPLPSIDSWSLLGLTKKQLEQGKLVPILPSDVKNKKIERRLKEDPITNEERLCRGIYMKELTNIKKGYTGDNDAAIEKVKDYYKSVRFSFKDSKKNTTEESVYALFRSYMDKNKVKVQKRKKEKISQVLRNQGSLSQAESWSPLKLNERELELGGGELLTSPPDRKGKKRKKELSDEGISIDVGRCADSMHRRNKGAAEKKYGEHAILRVNECFEGLYFPNFPGMSIQELHLSFKRKIMSRESEKKRERSGNIEDPEANKANEKSLEEGSIDQSTPLNDMEPPRSKRARTELSVAEQLGVFEGSSQDQPSMPSSDQSHQKDQEEEDPTLDDFIKEIFNGDPCEGSSISGSISPVLKAEQQEKTKKLARLKEPGFGSLEYLELLMISSVQPRISQQVSNTSAQLPSPTENPRNGMSISRR